MARTTRTVRAMSRWRPWASKKVVATLVHPSHPDVGGKALVDAAVVVTTAAGVSVLVVVKLTSEATASTRASMDVMLEAEADAGAKSMSVVLV